MNQTNFLRILNFIFMVKHGYKNNVIMFFDQYICDDVYGFSFH